jgi:hypothetical protein
VTYETSVFELILRIKRFNGFLLAESGDGGSVCIRRLKEEERNQKKTRQEELLEELESLKGFRMVIDALIEAKKPLIGHNMLLDVCHTYSAFCYDLPEDVEDFKNSVMSCFPAIIDTKHMANNFPILQEKMNSTALGEIVSIVEKEPFEFPVVSK